jgi:hypothetical protein
MLLTDHCPIGAFGLFGSPTDNLPLELGSGFARTIENRSADGTAALLSSMPTLRFAKSRHEERLSI